jgi:DNA primase
MSDPASKTIDRHEPNIPDYIQGEISQATERLQTLIKNRFVLRYCNVGQIKRWIKHTPKISNIAQKTITKELLDVALEITNDNIGNLTKTDADYLTNRGITDEEIETYKICSTEKIVKHLTSDQIANLSLKISDKFKDQVPHQNIEGISVPYFHDKDFYGYCTRVLNHDIIKYSITIPHRFCFGLEYSDMKEIYVVEGIFDAIKMKRDNYNCMALGDSQPNYWKMLMVNKFDNVNLLFDGDYSGMLGACKAHIILEEMLHRDLDHLNILLLDSGDPETSDNWVKTTLRDVASKLTILGKEI